MVWVITGDGDALSIGGNHLIHAMRRNVDMKMIMFNNRIYGLTKGQYSPTSEEGKKTKSTPMGSLDHPFLPLAFALGCEATFIARSVDIFTKEQRDVLSKKCPTEIAPAPWFLRDGETWTPDVRHEQATILKEALALDKQAVAEIESALAAVAAEKNP